jgi:hypothetical protein
MTMAPIFAPISSARAIRSAPRSMLAHAGLFPCLAIAPGGP